MRKNEAGKLDAMHAAAALRERVRAEALRLGFSLCGFTTAEPLGDAAERRRAAWLAEGRAGAMKYLERQRPRRTHLRDLLASAKSAIVVLAGYYNGDHVEEEDGEGERNYNHIRNSKLEIRNKSEIQNSKFENGGKIARYAWGRDYHEVLRERLTALGTWIAKEAAGSAENPMEIEFRPCVDSAPIDERLLAVRAGLGFIGKNTLLLTPDNGSWGLIGVLLTSLEFPPDAPTQPAPEASCGGCRKCIEACPTGAIDAPYKLDPRRCISYLTIEQKETIPMDLAEKMNGWIFGCDICQEVCPYNAAPLTRLIPELAASEGAGPFFGERTLAETPSGKAYARRWNGTPLARPGRKGMAKNLEAIRTRAKRETDEAPEGNVQY